MNKNRDPQMIPDAILNQLTEFTCGGFILFTIDAKGCPGVVYNFENPAAALALQNHMRHCAEAFEHINQASAYRGLRQGLGDE